jgi:hypothetical protein
MPQVRHRVARIAIGLACIATGIAALPESAALASPGAGQPSVSTAPHTTTATTVTTLTIPAARCAQLKAQYPSQAGNPRLCQATHIEKRTLTGSASQAAPLTGSASQAAPQACWSGTAWFQDQYVEFPGLYGMQLNSTFTYNCSVPTGVRITGCNINWWVIGQSISNIACWGYATNLPSRAAYEQWLVTLYSGPVEVGGYTAWQRRECYRGVPTGSCAWHWG